MKFIIKRMKHYSGTPPEFDDPRDLVLFLWPRNPNGIVPLVSMDYEVFRGITGQELKLDEERIFIGQPTNTR